MSGSDIRRDFLEERAEILFTAGKAKATSKHLPE